MKLCLAVLLVLSGFPVPTDAQEPSPYKGQERREVKALSKRQMANYLQGRGMGYAKSAELNHYPGPRHVLDLAAELGLSGEQIDQTNAIFVAMQTEAIKLGKRIVDLETELDVQFADRSVNPDILKKLVTEIGSLEAELRYAHLLAHLEQRAVLTSEQIEQYDRLRGYADKGQEGPDH